VRIGRLIDELFAIDSEAAHGESGPRRAPRPKQQTSSCVTCGEQSRNYRSTYGVLARQRPGQGRELRAGAWPKLTSFLEYPELELSNNLEENSRRPAAP